MIELEERACRAPVARLAPVGALLTVARDDLAARAARNVLFADARGVRAVRLAEPVSFQPVEQDVERAIDDVGQITGGITMPEHVPRAKQLAVRDGFEREPHEVRRRREGLRARPRRVDRRRRFAEHALRHQWLDTLRDRRARKAPSEQLFQLRFREAAGVRRERLRVGLRQVAAQEKQPREMDPAARDAWQEAREVPHQPRPRDATERQALAHAETIHAEVVKRRARQLQVKLPVLYLDEPREDMREQRLLLAAKRGHARHECLIGKLPQLHSLIVMSMTLNASSVRGGSHDSSLRYSARLETNSSLPVGGATALAPPRIERHVRGDRRTPVVPARSGAGKQFVAKSRFRSS